MDSEDARRRFEEMTLDEFRRRVDLAVAYVRDLRNGIAAATGMVLERVDRPMNMFDKEDAENAFRQIMEMLPLIRLSPEERAKLKPISEERREEMDDELEAMLEMDPEELNECMREGGLPYTYEDLLALKDESEKVRLLGVLQEEVQGLVGALDTLKSTLGDRMREILTAALQKAGGDGGAVN